MSSSGGQLGGRYRIVAEIGRGGFGSVFRALDEHTGRMVALKVLHGGLDETAAMRFVREAQISQSLSHPNVVRVFDFNADPPNPFIAYELLEGETLAALMKRGPMSPARGLHIILQVLRALAEAHDKGVIHRDIKPSNVMLQQFAGDRDVVKVLDFGIAKPLTPAATQLTQTGSVIGTPRFMSPEQISGGEMTPASDVYSVALLFAEMLSGQRIFTGGHLEVLEAQLEPGPVPLPAAVEYTVFAPALRRALDKQSVRRHLGAAALLAELEALAPQSGPGSVPSQPVQVAPIFVSPRPVVQTAPPALAARDAGGARHRLWLVPVALVAAGALVIGGVVGGALLWPQRTSKHWEAVAQSASKKVPGAETGVSKLDLKVLTRAMSRRGWSMRTSTGEVAIYTKGSLLCSFYSTRFASVEKARRANTHFSLNPPTMRFGTTVVTVSMQDRVNVFTKQAMELRDELIPELQAGAKRP